MPPKRFFVENIAEEVLLEGEEYRHAHTVLRLGVGDEVTLLDGSGREFSAIVEREDRRSFLLHVVGEKPADREPKADVMLLIGALKGDKTELVVQKATELGVSRVGVFSSKYCAAYMNENKLERLRRVAKEAAKQCLRSRVPEVEYFDNFAAAMSASTGYALKLFACEFLDKSEREISDMGGSFCLVVGPEGGFTEDEFNLAKMQGFVGVSLGKRILRAETAAIALLSVVMYRAGELR